MYIQLLIIGLIVLTMSYVTFCGSLEIREGLECKCTDVQKLIARDVSHNKLLTNKQFCAYKNTIGGDGEGCVWGDPDKWDDPDFGTCTHPTCTIAGAKAECINLNKRSGIATPKCKVRCVPPYPPSRLPSPPVIKGDKC